MYFFFLGKSSYIEHRPLPVSNGDLSKSLGGVRRPRKLGVGHGVAREDGLGTSERELSHEV